MLVMVVVMHGNSNIDDIKDIAKPILRHRIITNFTAEADGISKEDVLDQLIDQLKI